MSGKKNVYVIPYIIYLKLRGPLFKFGLESQRIYKNAITYDSTFKMSTNYHYYIQGDCLIVTEPSAPVRSPDSYFCRIRSRKKRVLPNVRYIQLHRN